MRTTVLFFLLSIGLRADFSAGLQAYQAKDYATALHEWQPLAEQGAPHAQYNLGLMYAMGQGVGKDPAQAAQWYEKAANQGINEAAFNLGLLYSEGQGVPQDFEQARKWFEKAAEAGDTKAASALADLCADKLHNYEEARKWYEKISGDNTARAQFDLGVTYDLGQGVPADAVEAGKWYRKSAEQGYAPAMTNIGVLYYNGQGVKRDLVLAHEYFLLGQKGGDPRASNLMECTLNKLNKKQVKRATELADQWQVEHASAQAANGSQPITSNPPAAAMPTGQQ